MCVCLALNVWGRELAICRAGHFPWSNTEHAQQHLIALRVVEPILLPMLQNASCIRSTEVMQHRRRIRCELFSGGWFEISWYCNNGMGRGNFKKRDADGYFEGAVARTWTPPLHHLPDRCKIWSLTNHKSVLHLWIVWRVKDPVHIFIKAYINMLQCVSDVELSHSNP